MKRAATRRPGAASGFVLVVVLALLVILSFIAATIGVITQRLRDQQLERQEQQAAQRGMASTRATLLYLLMSQRTTFGGLTVDSQVALSEDERRDLAPGEFPVSNMPVGNEIALDGRAYEGLEGVRFALQDDRGLLGINWAPPVMIQRYLGETDGAEAPPVDSLVNLLRDYQDPDDLYRLNSAEREGYARRGLPGPSNRTLVTPLELRRIVGWKEALAGRSDLALLETLTVVRSPIINVNTAPAEVLRTLPGVELSLAQRLVDLRMARPFVRVSDVQAVFGGLSAYEELLSLYPSGSGTLKLWSPDGGSVQVVHWTLTPRDEGGRPWREDYEFSFPRSERMDQDPPRRAPAAVFSQSDAEAQGRPDPA